ncbi:LOW QUALITY PROTEIN: hypothetical protein BRADI_4g10500v3 [Brachypodium distachyon]|uniref:Protein kinase domain-containing protein n=1 Tax=Brachypodium distachyon TaxID=15368 RepID=A0A2K2CLX1_BRADI|nr:LOW QUALITY PROTEIN: hypothetical protein BRADI_4g10500v3 [Brachypodium distachyon]
MALWTGLGQAATVAQLVGADIGGLISMIMQAALTARQNRRECEQLARRVFMIAELLPHLQLQDPEAVRPLAGLGDTLRDAHELVLSYQGRSVAYQFVMAGKQADRFREVQSRIDSYLILFPVISYIGITRRLDRIYNILVPDSATSSHSTQLQESAARVAEEVPRHVGAEEFTLAELVEATNNFACDAKLGSGGSAMRGRLHDRREVAVKRYYNHWRNHTELAILSSLRHKHIIRLLGWCTVDKEYKRLLSFRRKEQEKEQLLILEYMENGTLSDHLHRHPSSPVIVSWKMRINVLLGVVRAMEHLHCHAVPPVIHRDIKPSNILFDLSWVPRLSDFGVSVTSDEEPSSIAGTCGYLAPEYPYTGLATPAVDVYSLGVVILEVLTGKAAIFQGERDSQMDLVCFALPVIEDGNYGELLDKRPVPEPTLEQLNVLEHVAQTAACCVQMQWQDRPAISDIVASLEIALQHITLPSTSLAGLCAEVQVVPKEISPGQSRGCMWPQALTLSQAFLEHLVEEAILQTNIVRFAWNSRFQIHASSSGETKN